MGDVHSLAVHKTRKQAARIAAARDSIDESRVMQIQALTTMADAIRRLPVVDVDGDLEEALRGLHADIQSLLAVLPPEG